MVHTPKGPVASGLGEAEVMLEEAVVEAGEVTPCRMPALTMLMQGPFFAVRDPNLDLHVQSKITEYER